MSMATHSRILTWPPIAHFPALLVKLAGAPALAVALLVSPYAFVAGLLPIRCAMPYTLMAFLGDSRDQVGAVYVSTPSDPNERRFVDWRHLWRAEFGTSVLDQLVSERELESVDSAEVPEYFWTQSPLWWPNRPPQNARFFKTAGWAPNDRGEEDFNFLMMYDPTEGAAYFWVKHNI
jgi:hypothetical protein